LLGEWSTQIERKHWAIARKKVDISSGSKRTKATSPDQSTFLASCKVIPTAIAVLEAMAVSGGRRLPIIGLPPAHPAPSPNPGGISGP